MSLTAAWAPVPLTGQSSMTWPALRNARSARCLSSSLNVPASTTILAGSLSRLIAATVASSACGLGRLRIITGAAAASVATSGAISTPARFAARLRAASMSKPSTRQPAAARCLAKAPPILPSPTTPTVPLLRFAISAVLALIAADAITGVCALCKNRHVVDWLRLTLARMGSAHFAKVVALPTGAPIAYRPPRSHQGEPHECGSSRSRQYGRRNRRATDRDRRQGHGLEPLGREMQAARGRWRKRRGELCRAFGCGGQRHHDFNL